MHRPVDTLCPLVDTPAIEQALGAPTDVQEVSSRDATRRCVLKFAAVKGEDGRPVSGPVTVTVKAEVTGRGEVDIRSLRQAWTALDKGTAEDNATRRPTQYTFTALDGVGDDAYRLRHLISSPSGGVVRYKEDVVSANARLSIEVQGGFNTVPTGDEFVVLTRTALLGTLRNLRA